MIILAIVVAAPTIKALAAWMLKRRRKQRIELRARVLYNDGTEVERTALISFSESDAPQAEVIKQLTEGLGISGDSLMELLDGDTGGKS
jgi:hypothetical protein